MVANNSKHGGSQLYSRIVLIRLYEKKKHDIKKIIKIQPNMKNNRNRDNENCLISHTEL